MHRPDTYLNAPNTMVLQKCVHIIFFFGQFHGCQVLGFFGLNVLFFFRCCYFLYVFFMGDFFFQFNCIKQRIEAGKKQPENAHNLARQLKSER